MSRSFIDCKLYSILTSASRDPSAIAELFVFDAANSTTEPTSRAAEATYESAWGQTTFTIIIIIIIYYY